MTALRRPWQLLVVPLLLAGCATTASPAASGNHGASPAAATSAAHDKPTADGAPPPNAQMICDDDVKGKVAQALQLPSAPATQASWTPPRYSCSYRLPAGPMTLSVQVSPNKDAAHGFFDQQRPSFGQTETLDGLGERAYGNRNGIVVVSKDDMTLTVDTTQLPPVFGTNDQKRFDFAYEVASVVLGCWTGDD